MKRTKSRKIKLTKSFYSAFSLLFALLFLIFIGFSAYTYYASLNALQHELLAYSQTQAVSIGDIIDNHFQDMHYVMASLYYNSFCQGYLSTSDPDSFLGSTHRIIIEQQKAYKNVFPHLDSIYLYSPASDSVLLHTGLMQARHLGDINWQEAIPQAVENDHYAIFSRKKNDNYPYLITILKTLPTNHGPAAICVNVDLSKMVPLSSFSGRSNETVYIVSDDGELLYRYSQREYLEPYTTVEELQHFDASAREKQLFVNEAKPYIFTQLHSSNYGWSYVLVTDITDYTAQLSTTTNFSTTVLIFAFLIAVVLVFFVALRSTRPIGSIVRLLESPEDFVVADITGNEKKIVQKIMTYIQANASLTQDLDAQLIKLNEARLVALQTQINPHFLMNTLNTIRMMEIEALGFEHRVPNMTLSLSRLLQYALDSTDNVSVSTEMRYVQLFTQIMNQRYNGTIDIRLLVDEDAKHVLIPKLTIQPLIENAIFHGLSALQDDRQKTLSVAVQRNGAQCVLTVSDNGIGIGDQKLAELIEDVSNFSGTPNSSIGLHNVVLRMHLLYGDAFTFQIHSAENQGTSITLRFPSIPANPG